MVISYCGWKYLTVRVYKRPPMFTGACRHDFRILVLLLVIGHMGVAYFTYKKHDCAPLYTPECSNYPEAECGGNSSATLFYLGCTTVAALIYVLTPKFLCQKCCQKDHLLSFLIGRQYDGSGASRAYPGILIVDSWPAS